MLAASFTAFLVSQPILRSHHVETTLSSPHVLRAVVGAALFLTVTGLFGLSLGALVRNTAGGIATFAGPDVRPARASPRSSPTAGATASTPTCRSARARTSSPSTRTRPRSLPGRASCSSSATRSRRSPQPPCCSCGAMSESAQPGLPTIASVIAIASTRTSTAQIRATILARRRVGAGRRRARGSRGLTRIRDSICAAPRQRPGAVLTDA